MTLSEDLSQTHTGNGPQVMAAIRNLVISLHRLTGATNIAAASVSRFCSSKALAETYASSMTCRVEVFVRSGHTIDLALEDGEDRTFAHALREAWASPEAIGFTHLALGENAVILASEVVGYRLHGTLPKNSTL